MTDITKYLSEGIVLDQNFAFKGKGKSINDCIAQMQSDGLRVDFINNSGELVRVSVTATHNTRPDKSNEKSGWYVFNESNDFQVAVWGNWRTGIQNKWSSVDVNTLSSYDKQRLNTEMEKAVKQREEDKKTRQQEVADEVKERFGALKNVTNHQYLDVKKVNKNIGLKELNGNLIIPVQNCTTGELRSLQYINKKGEKRFVSASEVSGNVFPVGFDLNTLKDIKSVVICEGVATGSSINEATNLPVLVVFSAMFGVKAIENIRKVTDAKIYICFDNDKSGVGQQKAKECADAFPNCLVRLPSDVGDFNDIHLKEGLEAIKLEIESSGIGIRSFAVRNLVGPPPVQQFLVDGLIPLGVNGILGAIGGIGKSMTCLDLALKVSSGQGKFWGKEILQTGSSVIFSSEDSKDEVHRRLSALDPIGARFNSVYDVYVVTIPDLGKPLILLDEDNINAMAVELVEEIKSIPNLTLTVFDPLQSFVGASSPISSSNESAQLWGSFTAGISAQTGSTTLSVHHMSKDALTGTESSIDSLRQLRGASAISDSSRFVISMWLSKDWEEVCIEQGEEPHQRKVVNASLVKSNSGDVDTSIMTLFRKDGSPVLDVLNKHEGIKWD